MSPPLRPPAENVNFRGALITGADTGVGKTVITAALALVLKGAGLRVEIMKPVETGCAETPRGLAPHDALLLRRVIRSRAPLDLICPYRFAPPVAPMVAAEHAATEIDLDRLTACWRELGARADVVLVEGAGGLAVPLRRDLDYAALAQRWQAPLLLVIDNRLGCVNHARLTAAYAERAGLRLLGYILNHAQPTTDTSASTNADTLQRLLGVPCLGIVPHKPAPAVCTDLLLDQDGCDEAPAANDAATYFRAMANALNGDELCRAIWGQAPLGTATGDVRVRRP